MKRSSFVMEFCLVAVLFSCRPLNTDEGTFSCEKMEDCPSGQQCCQNLCVANAFVCSPLDAGNHGDSAVEDARLVDTEIADLEHSDTREQNDAHQPDASNSDVPGMDNASVADISAALDQETNESSVNDVTAADTTSPADAAFHDREADDVSVVDTLPINDSAVIDGHIPDSNVVDGQGEDIGSCGDGGNIDGGSCGSLEDSGSSSDSGTSQICMSTVESQFSETFGNANFDTGGRGIIETSNCSLAAIGTSEGGLGMFLVITDASGGTIHERHYSESANNDTAGLGIIEDAPNGYLLTGRAAGGPNGGFDGRFIRVTYSGDVTWNKYYGGAGDDALRKAIPLSSGGYALCGTKDTGGVRDGWLVITDVSGNVSHERSYGGSGGQIITSCIQLHDGDLLLVGYNNANTAGGDDGWIIRTDPIGNFRWDTKIGGTSNDYIQEVVELDNYNLATGGLTSSASAGSYDFWIQELSQSGDVIWSKTYGGTGDDEMYSFIKTRQGYAAVGYTTSKGAGLADVWLLAVDSSGAVTLDRTYGGTAEDQGFGLVETAAGGYAISARTESYGSGGMDFWIIRTSANGETVVP